MRQQDNWYEILPFMTPYKDEYALFAPPHNFCFVLSKDSTLGMRMFIKARKLNSSAYEAQQVAGDGLPFKIYAHNARLRMMSVYPMAKSVVRDRVFDLFKDSEMDDSCLIVFAQKILHYTPLYNEVQDRRRGNGVFHPATQDGRKRLLASKNSEEMFLCHVFISSENPRAAQYALDYFPADMTNFFISGASRKKVLKYLNKNPSESNGMPSVDKLGYALNLFGLNTVRDTVLNKVELANIVQLPLNRPLYPLPQGHTEEVSQSFVMTEDEKADWEIS